MKVMFYAPHSAIWVFAFPEALVAEALMQEGNEIVYIGCRRQFRSYCVAMSAYGLKFDSPEASKEKVCQICERNKALLRKGFGLKGSDVADELTADDDRQIENILQNASPENYLDLDVSGIKVGRLALYEFLLNHKKNDLTIGEHEWKEFRGALKNSIASALASLKIIEREKPDRLITYNSFYAVNHVACKAAEKYSVPHYLLHAGATMANRMETLSLTKGYSYNYITRSSLWQLYRNFPCTKSQLSKVTDHILTLFKARSVFVYSRPASGEHADLRARFGISATQKVLVATMSSHDERFASVTIGTMPDDPGVVFPTQVDWIKALVAYVTIRPELFLIIRVHPREFPNKRESVVSAYAAQLQSQLTNLPANVRVNWPSDNISLYDLASIVDVFLNSRSTTGLEMAWLGLPVVVYSPDQLYSYPPDLSYTANSQDEYFQKIEKALGNGWDIEFSRMAYRWGVFQFCHDTVNISESYTSREERASGILAIVFDKMRRKLAPEHLKRQDIRRRTPELKSKSLLNHFLETGKNTLVEAIDVDDVEKSSLAEETEALRCELGRIYSALYQTERNPLPSSLQQHILNFINSKGADK